MRSCSVRAMVWILIVVVSEVHILSKFIKLGASLEPQMVKNLPAVQETLVRSLGQEDPLEKGMATLSSVLVWRILRTGEPGGLQSMGLQRVGND